MLLNKSKLSHPRDDEIPGNRVRRIVCDSEIRGGIPVLSGTRIGAQEVFNIREKHGMQEVFRIWPHLTSADVEEAVKYIETHAHVHEH